MTWVIAPPTPSKLKSFCWNIWFYKVFSCEICQISCEICWISCEIQICQISWNLPDFKIMSFCIMIKYMVFWKMKDQKFHHKLLLANFLCQTFGKGFRKTSIELCYVVDSLHVSLVQTQYISTLIKVKGMSVNRSFNGLSLSP